MDRTVDLSFYCLGDTDTLIFSISVSLEDKVKKLLDLIEKEYIGHLDWPTVTVYQTNRSTDDLPSSLDELDASDQVIEARHRVNRYWLDPRQVDEDRVQVLVHSAATRPIHPEPPQDGPVELSSILRDMQLQHNKTASWFRKSKPPSQTARPDIFVDQQKPEAAPILNGRSVQCTGLPIQLFHPVFDHFSQSLEATDELTASEYKNVQKLAHTVQAINHVEGLRWTELIKCFCVSLDPSITRDIPVENCKPDGLIWFTDPALGTKLNFAIIEVMNEVETGGCDPSVQAAEAYGVCWSQGDVSPIREICGCPSLIIAMAGPWMCTLGAVYLDHITIQPLTNYIWLGHHPQQDMHLRQLTRVFRAAKNSVTELSNYYASLSSALLRPEDLMRFPPHIRQYRAQDGNVTTFTYTGFIDQSTNRPVFTAVTESGKDIVVKFAEQYNIEAHQLLVPKQLAPTVLSYEAPTHTRGFHCVIMERIQSVSLHQWHTEHATVTGLEVVRRDVQTALETLHGSGLVFGDLRLSNVLGIGQGGLTGAMLVDFDWCGQDSIARYPAGMNDDRTINWPDGAERGGLMMKQHDLDMFERLFK